MSESKSVRVKLNTSRCGNKVDEKGRVTGTFSQAVGDEVDMPADEAKRYVDSGMASYAK